MFVAGDMREHGLTYSGIDEGVVLIGPAPMSVTTITQDTVLNVEEAVQLRCLDGGFLCRPSSFGECGTSVGVYPT